MLVTVNAGEISLHELWRKESLKRHRFRRTCILTDTNTSKMSSIDELMKFIAAPPFKIKKVAVYSPGSDFQLDVSGEKDNNLVCINIYKSCVDLHVSGNNLPKMNSTVEEISKFFPKVVREKNVVPVSFHYWNASCARKESEIKSIKISPWNSALHNYSASTRNTLEDVMKQKMRGRISIWHGPPGTGKTHALYSLFSEWNEKSSYTCILDPEEFLRNTSYMLSCLNGNGGKNKVIILEDSGELIGADAKDRVGQGLSRLLNISDGMIGRDLNLSIIITTNEPLMALHPAIIRPGRCADIVEFTPLSEQEAKSWAAEHKINPAKVQGSKTIAELYNMLTTPQIGADKSSSSNVIYA